MDIWGICPGRFTRKNRLTPTIVAEKIASLPQFGGVQPQNERNEFCHAYKETASALPKLSDPVQIVAKYTPPQRVKKEILILGSAGQRVITAGELLCLAALSGGLQATQKNDYDITVLKGPSVSEIILWPADVGYTGISNPDIILAISGDGVKRRNSIFSQAKKESVVIHAKDIYIPKCNASLIAVDFKKLGISSKDRALASLGVLANNGIAVNYAMMAEAMLHKFSSEQAKSAEKVLEKIRNADISC